MSVRHTAALGKGPGLGASSPVASSAQLVRSAARQPRDADAPTELRAHGSEPSALLACLGMAAPGCWGLQLRSAERTQPEVTSRSVVFHGKSRNHMPKNKHRCSKEQRHCNFSFLQQ